MSELFVVWMATTGVFGFSAEKSIKSACELAAATHGQVFRLRDPGVRYAMACVGYEDEDCNFPGWITVPVVCAKVPESSAVVPAHWEIK